MLVLSRKVGESIHIGDNVIVTVREIDKNQIKLSIDAPQDVKIWRGELLEDIKRENLKAVSRVDINELKRLRIRR